MDKRKQFMFAKSTKGGSKKILYHVYIVLQYINIVPVLFQNHKELIVKELTRNQNKIPFISGQLVFGFGQLR